MRSDTGPAEWSVARFLCSSTEHKISPLDSSHEEPTFLVMKRYLPESVDKIQDHKFYSILIVVQRGRMYGPVFVETIQLDSSLRLNMLKVEWGRETGGFLGGGEAWVLWRIELLERRTGECCNDCSLSRNERGRCTRQPAQGSKPEETSSPALGIRPDPARTDDSRCAQMLTFQTCLHKIK